MAGTKILAITAALALALSGCTTLHREEPTFKKPIKPTSADIDPEVLSEADQEFCRSDPRGSDLCRKFLINRARHEQSNRWIVRTWDSWPE